jgi:hypothetical protein
MALPLQMNEYSSLIFPLPRYEGVEKSSHSPQGRCERGGYAEKTQLS